jgi:hypothetical protein
MEITSTDIINYINKIDSIAELEKIKNAILNKIEHNKTENRYQILRCQLIDEWFQKSHESLSSTDSLIIGWNKIDCKKTFFADSTTNLKCENDCNSISSTYTYPFHIFLLWKSIVLCESCFVKIEKHFVSGRSLSEEYLKEYKIWCENKNEHI